MNEPKPPRELTTDEKREYLRLLMTEGPDTANAYYHRQRLPAIMVFDSDEAVERYRQEHGHLSSIVIIAPIEEEEPPRG